VTFRLHPFFLYLLLILLQYLSRSFVYISRWMMR
jgi:hypothetical protein